MGSYYTLRKKLIEIIMCSVDKTEDFSVYKLSIILCLNYKKKSFLMKFLTFFLNLKKIDKSEFYNGTQ